MAMGIDRQIQARMALGQDRLQQEYAQTQQLIDLLALQKLSKEKAEAARAIQASMQTNPATVKDQLEQQLVAQSREGIASMMPGIQMQGQRMAEAQARSAAGIPSQSAPNMARMAGGGIVAFQDGGDVDAVQEYIRLREKLRDPNTSPEARQTIQQMLEDMKRMSDDESRFIRDVETSSGFDPEREYEESMNEMYGGGRIRGYAGPDGSVVESDAEEDEGGFMQVASDVADWATENPLEAASMGLMFIPGIGWGASAGLRGLGAVARFGKPLLQKYGPRALQGLGNIARRTVTRPTTRVSSTTGRRIPVYRPGPGGNPQQVRQFSPMRASFTAGAGLNIADKLLNGEETAEETPMDAVDALEQMSDYEKYPFAAEDKVAQDYRAAMVEAENLANQAKGIQDPEKKQNFIMRGLSAIGSIFDLPDEKFDQLMAFGTGAASGTNIAESLRLGAEGVGRTRSTQQTRRDELEKQRRAEEMETKQFDATMALEREKLNVQEYVAQLNALKGLMLDPNEVRQEILGLMSDIAGDSMQVLAIRQAIADREGKDLTEVTQTELSTEIRLQAQAMWEAASGMGLGGSEGTLEELDPALAADMAKYGVE